MSTSKESQTIAGSYCMVTLPDKTQALVEKIKLPNGKITWVFVEDRLDDTEEFDNRFKDTDTVPQDLRTPVTKPLTAKPGQAQKTREHLEAHLIEVLGTPTGIIAQKGLDPAHAASLRKNTAERVTIIKIIEALNMEPWISVLPYI